MGSDRAKLFARCCYAAVTLVALCVMFWIAWCLFGLTAVQVSEAQRRALVHYSPAPKATPTSPAPARSTTAATEETSAANAISKLPTTASLRKEPAKGDFATRERHNGSHDGSTAALSPPRGPIPAKPEEKEDHQEVHARKVLGPGPENRPEEDKGERRKGPEPAPDITPTRVHDAGEGEGSQRSRPDTRTDSRDYSTDLPRRDDVQGSRRTEPGSVYLDTEPPRRRPSRPGYRDDDEDDERSGSRRRNSKGYRYSDDIDAHPEDDDRFVDRDRERTRKGDDGDRYRYRDERPRDRDPEVRPPVRDDRYRDEERYRQRNDDKYRDRDDERYRYRDDERYRFRDDDRHRDDDRYRDDHRDDHRDDERYRVRDEGSYRSRDDERYRSRDDESYRSRDDERYRPRDDDKYRYRDDERYVPSDDDKRRSRDDESYRDESKRVRDDDRPRSRDDERYRTDSADRKDPPRRFDNDKDGYRPRTDDEKYVDTSVPVLRTAEDKGRSSSDLPAVKKKPISSHYEYDLREEGTVTDYDVPSRDGSRSRESPSRLPRPPYDDEERYRERIRDDEYRRPSRYENDRIEISPTRTREESSLSRSLSTDSRPRGTDDDPKYADDQRDRYYDKDRARIQGSRSSSSTSESSRRYSDDRDRYRTRLPDERSSDRREEVVLDRRSYASEDEEYRRRDSGRGDDNRDRRPIDDARRRDENYSRRDQVGDDDYKSRRPSDYDRDRSRSSDRYDDDYSRYDDRHDSRDDKRSSSSRGDRPPPLPVSRYDSFSDYERPRSRDPDVIESSRNLRPSSSTRDEEWSRDDHIDSKPPARRRYDDDPPASDGRRYSDGSRRPPAPTLGSSMTTTYSREPSDVVVREKRFQSTTESRFQSSRVDETLDSGRSRPKSAKDVIEAANRQSDASDQNARKVYYPVFDPRLTNMTSPEIIRPSERRGTTITARKRRSA